MDNDLSNLLNFQMVSNNKRTVESVVLNPDDGSLVNLSGAVIIWQLFYPGTRSPIATKQTSDGSIIVLDQTAKKGRFQFTIQPDDTKDLDSAYYPHEAVISIGGDPVTLTSDTKKEVVGTVYIRRQYTPQT